MPPAFFRITQEDGRDTTTGQDPYLEVGYFFQGLGTVPYTNQTIQLIAAPRKNGYPATRWILLQATQRHIGAVLHLERSDLWISDGQLENFKDIGPIVPVYNVHIKVHGARSVAGGTTFTMLATYHVTREPDEPSLFDDILNRRGRRLARRAASWVWDQLF